MRSKILWSDETKIELFGLNAKHPISRKYDPLPMVMHGGMFSAAGTGRLVRIEGKIWYWNFSRIPISCCKSSSYSSWGPHKTCNIIKNDIIQNIIRQEQNYIHFLKRHTLPRYQCIHTNYLGQIGERRSAVRCCFICFLKPSLLFICAI